MNTHIKLQIEKDTSHEIYVSSFDELSESIIKYASRGMVFAISHADLEVHTVYVEHYDNVTRLLVRTSEHIVCNYTILSKFFMTYSLHFVPFSDLVKFIREN